MPSSTTARRSAATKTVETVSAAIDHNQKYVAKAPTANLVAFHEFVRGEMTEPLKTKAEQEAFDLGLRLSGLRAAYQKDRKSSAIPADQSFVDYAIKSSGIKVPTGAAHDALVAGINSYTRYVAFRNARNAASVK